jgi:eukaryotic-like serine/threonine-protein kinase
VHYLPEPYYVALRERPAALRDRRLGQRLGDALLAQRLSRGAFGQLYLALQLPLERPVAVKIFDPVSSNRLERDTLGEMFDREARALAALSHPNVVRLLAFDGEHEPPYLIMEYIEGGRTLRHLLEERERLPAGLRRLPPRRAFGLLAQILWALAEAHQRGVVHLDLRPDNVGVQHPEGYEDFVRLLDFGLAAHRDDAGDARGFGTPEYIAPERIVGGAATPAADLYAVGVMACQLLLGRSPFGERSADELVAAKRDPAFAPAEAIASAGYAPRVVDFFRRALAHSPDDRFVDARAFVAALEHVVAVLDEGAS